MKQSFRSKQKPLNLKVVEEEQAWRRLAKQIESATRRAAPTLCFPNYFVLRIWKPLLWKWEAIKWSNDIFGSNHLGFANNPFSHLLHIFWNLIGIPFSSLLLPKIGKINHFCSRKGKEMRFSYLIFLQRFDRNFLCPLGTSISSTPGFLPSVDFYTHFRTRKNPWNSNYRILYC